MSFTHEGNNLIMTLSLVTFILCRHLNLGIHCMIITILADYNTGFNRCFFMTSEILLITHLTTVPDEGSETAALVTPVKAN